MRTKKQSLHVISAIKYTILMSQSLKNFLLKHAPGKEVLKLRKDFALTVKAVIMKGDKFLVLKRSKKEIDSSLFNRKEAWDLPGGGVRFNETAEHGLFREIHEETGIKISLKRILNAYDAIRSNIHMLILTYVCIYKEGEVILSSEHDAYYWLTLDEMNERKLPEWMIRDFRIVYNDYYSKT